MGKSEDQPFEDALADAFLKEREWVWCHMITKLITKKVEEDILKKLFCQEQVTDLVDILERERKLGEFYKLLKINHGHVIAKLVPRFERQRSVNEAVEGQSQINTAVKQRRTSRRYDQDDNLCHIVIDGRNVAMEHGNDKIFSCIGIQLCVDYYREKGHKKITVYVPGWCKCKPTQEHPISDQHILNKLKDEKCLVYTLDKKLDGKHIVCDYTKCILNLAVRTGGIVVSNDSYKDLKNPKKEWGEIIRKRVTGFVFVKDDFITPDYPTSPSSDELQSSSAASPGDQVASPEVDKASNLRNIVVDGCNVAMTHGNDKNFSCKGIQLCVEYYVEKGHKVTAFVPKSRTWEATPENPIPHKHPILDQHILDELNHQGFLACTPVKWIDGKLIECYDDKYILNLAVLTGGIVVSNDSFKDLKNKHEAWGEIVRKRVTGYCIVGDYFMPPDDPYGKDGPHVDKFLQKSPPEEVTGSSSTYCMARDQELQAGPASSLNKKNALGKRCPHCRR